ncbi:hypothetical protein GCM10023160_14150 [Brachybacterium paraconglomeratum]|uniref:hypothetical protein n=1 Tax=Brachybacterium paraconglomeratum TaxID=173362 RepID=UPI0031EBBDAF
MLFTRDMAAAFGDWLERERIHDVLVTARPELGGRLVLDEERPLLRIPLPDGTDMVVAKTDEPTSTGWVLGIPAPHAPALHEPSSLGELVSRVLEVLDSWGSRDGRSLQD